ncbi:MAG: hypothetical protein M1812_006861 [Candelaria pacifica]|nr:MAG: hypothetical protein M1812_006861 [Candelaria pacifica]
MAKLVDTIVKREVRRAAKAAKKAWRKTVAVFKKEMKGEPLPERGEDGEEDAIATKGPRRLLAS